MSNSNLDNHEDYILKLKLNDVYSEVYNSIVENKSIITFKTNSLNQIRMLEYLKLHIEDVTLEDIENIIKNK